MLQNTVIPETPMFRPEFRPQEPEPGVILLDEDGAPVVRDESALECLPPYDPNRHSGNGSPGSFLYWTIRDYAHAYRFRHVTPSMVAEHVISYVEESKNKKVPNPLLISFIAEDVRKQAMASTRRFEEGRPLSVLDGIFMAVKDDIDCFPHPTRGATTWFHEVRPVHEDAVCVSRLRSCGVIFVGKANLHELGLATTGNNPNYGIVRNPHSIERYTGGSSKGPAAIVSLGLCPAALGTDGGGSNQIASSLCGVVGMKTTYGQTDVSGALYDCGTVEVIASIASTVEDAMLVGLMMSIQLISLISARMFFICFQRLMDAKKGAEVTLDSRIDLAVYRAFTAAEYVSAARIRRRIMYYHMEAFKKVDIIVNWHHDS